MWAGRLEGLQQWSRWEGVDWAFVECVSLKSGSRVFISGSWMRSLCAGTAFSSIDKHEEQEKFCPSTAYRLCVLWHLLGDTVIATQREQVQRQYSSTAQLYDGSLDHMRGRNDGGNGKMRTWGFSILTLLSVRGRSSPPEPEHASCTVAMHCFALSVPLAVYSSHDICVPDA